MSVCPGCGVELPDSGWTARGDGYNASPECRAVQGEVAGYTAAHIGLLENWHQMCVDAYLCQHVGPGTKAISICFGLNGLYMMLERGFTGLQARAAHGYQAENFTAWPRFEPPPDVGPLTAVDVALAGSPEEHVDLVRRWGRQVWDAWSHAHEEIAALTDGQLRGWRPS
jgi:hypothetical protein